MSDGRWTKDFGRRIGAFTVVVGTTVGVVVLGVVGVRTWVNRNRVIEVEDYQGVVFSQAHAALVLGPMLSADSNGFWTPTAADIQSFEHALATAAQVRHPEGLRPLGEYRRQYFGYSLNGKRRILVVGFCDPNGLEWTEAFVSAGEGGCHFEATYAVDQDAISNFWALDVRGLPGSSEVVAYSLSATASNNRGASRRGMG
jgi:hypothetical protein